MDQPTITCFNRDENGKCLAYTMGRCHSHCKARITDIGKKVELLRCLLTNSQSRKEQRKYEKELEIALRLKSAIEEKKFEGWMACYMEDRRRGEKGGASESDANRSTRMKALMKDNRPVDVKPSKAQQEEYKAALEEWEDKNGKLDRLSRSSMSSSRIDSYTQIPICFCDSGEGHCRGQRSAKGHLAKDCKDCGYLE